MPLPPHPGLQSSPTPINPTPFINSSCPQAAPSSRPGGYSSVNKLSMLPDEMRTADNLEGGTIPTGEVQEDLLVKYRKDREDYEKRQLLKMTELKAKRDLDKESHLKMTELRAKRDMDKESQGMTATHPQLVPEAPREAAPRSGHRVDPYEFPADAVSHQVGKVGVVAGKKATTPPGHAKLTVSVDDVVEGYTSVYNTLPKQHAEKAPLQQPRTARGSSLSDPPTSPQAGGGGGAYENSPGPSPSKQATGNDTLGKSSARQDGKEVVHLNRNRQSKRKAKEVVEFDPNKSKKFHVTADRQDDDTDQANSSPQGEGSVTTPTQGFSVQGDGVGQQSYALVNMDDKRTRRVGSSDINKVEGSGIPLHYRVAIPSS